MLWKILEKTSLAVLCIATGLTVGGLVTNDLWFLDALVITALAFMTLIAAGLFGYGLYRLTHWLDRLSDTWFSALIAVWMIGWLVAGILGTLLINDDTLAKGCELLSVLLAFSIPTLRAWPAIREDFGDESKKLHYDRNVHER